MKLRLFGFTFSIERHSPADVVKPRHYRTGQWSEDEPPVVPTSFNHLSLGDITASHPQSLQSVYTSAMQNMAGAAGTAAFGLIRPKRRGSPFGLGL